jgi:hypothetical protein
LDKTPYINHTVAVYDTVQGTVRTVAMQSTLPEYPGDITESDVHVQALAERVAHYARVLRADGSAPPQVRARIGPQRHVEEKGVAVSDSLALIISLVG